MTAATKKKKADGYVGVNSDRPFPPPPEFTNGPAPIEREPNPTPAPPPKATVVEVAPVWCPNCGIKVQ